MKVKTVVFLIVLSLGLYQSTDTDLGNENSEQKMFVGFMKFIVDNEKYYSSLDELQVRYNIFKQNMVSMNITDFDYGNQVNSTDTEEGWTKGITPHSDLTHEEFTGQFLTLTNSSIPDDLKKYDFDTEDGNTFLSANQTQGRSLQTVPASWDWRTYGAVTAVKNQGSCGSCWAFAATANIEGIYYIKYKKSYQFSEQQIIDCNYAGSGCGGGISANALYYVQYAGGIMLKSNYPYVGNRAICRFQSSKVFARIKSYVSAGTTDETSILLMMLKNGPLAVAMNADPLQFYAGGVLDLPYSSCNPNNLNHAVTLIGYGVTSTGKKYWIIKNSWGPYWGESGFFRISRGKGTCGINLVALSAIIQ